MPKPSLGEIEGLLQEIVFPFYQIERDMPLPPDQRNENDAEHSWALAFLACVLAPEIDPTLDVGKVCQFAVIHDVVEVYAGDTSVWSAPEKLADKVEREAKATREISKRFLAFPQLASLIESYERKDSPEAQFIYALDKFLNLLVVYQDKGKKYRARGITRQDFDAMTDRHRKKAHAHDSIKDYYDELLELHLAHPEYFYQGAENG